jgi:hypothetical protein
MKDCHDRGLGVLGCIAFGNKLYGPVWEDQGRQAYARFAAALAEHYKGQEVIWEIWNEPNTQTFWGNHGKHNSEQYADEYVALVKATAPAMKKANPDCLVLGGSTSGVWSESYAWMGFCFQKGVLQSGIDAWSVHPYSTKCPEDYLEAYATVRQLMVKNGGSNDFPILDTERGYPLGKAEGYAGGNEAMSAQYQAWHFVRQYMMDLLCNVRLTNWYEWSGKEGFSLVLDGHQTPAYRAAQVMLEQLDGYRLAERLPLKSDRDFVLRFTKQNAPDKLVAWTAPAVGGDPDETKPHAVDVPVKATSDWVETSEIYGQAGAAPVKAGLVQLQLEGAPRYVTLHAVPAPLAAPTAAAPPAAPQAAADKPTTAPSTDLKIFDKGVEWKFMKNTGEGSFTLAVEDGKPIGVMDYDFTQSKAKSTPYVLAWAPVQIPEGTTQVQLKAKAKSAIKHQVTIRLTDQTGQIHQYKIPVAGSGDWVTIHLILTKRAEHWGGANDGKMHFPIQQITLSIPEPSDTKTGKMEFSDAVAIEP